MCIFRLEGFSRAPLLDFDMCVVTLLSQRVLTCRRRCQQGGRPIWISVKDLDGLGCLSGDKPQARDKLSNHWPFIVPEVLIPQLFSFEIKQGETRVWRTTTDCREERFQTVKLFPPKYPGYPKFRAKRPDCDLNQKVSSYSWTSNLGLE
jgi:hypothetical protein